MREPVIAGVTQSADQCRHGADLEAIIDWKGWEERILHGLCDVRAYDARLDAIHNAAGLLLKAELAAGEPALQRVYRATLADRLEWPDSGRVGQMCERSTA